MDELPNLAIENAALKEDKQILLRDDTRHDAALAFSVVLNIIFIGLWLYEVFK